MIFIYDIFSLPDKDYLTEVQSSTNRTITEDELHAIHRKMVCWSALWIRDSGEPRQQHAWAGTDAKEGLSEFSSTLNTYKDFSLLHYNGRTTSLPLLTYQALTFHQTMPARLFHHDIQYRYSRYNTDLADTLSSYGASPVPKLDELMVRCGLPVISMPDEQEVAALLDKEKQTELKNISQYRVMSIYLIWLELQHVSGDLAEDQYQNLRSRAMGKALDLAG